MTEAQLHKAVADFLNVALIPPTWWTTFPLGGGGYVRGAQLRSRGARKGTPDILIIDRGRPIWIELKTEKGRLNAAQQDTFLDLSAAQSPVFICRSVDAVARILDGYGVHLRARAA